MVIDDAINALGYLSSPKSQISDSPYLRPGLIFLDINMSRMNGFEFLKEYTNLDGKLKSNALVIMLSTSLNPYHLEIALSYKEVVDFKNKPLTVADIHDIVDRFSAAK